MKFSNFSVQNALFQRRKRLSTKGCSEKKPRFELLKVQLPGGDSFRLRTVDVGLWHPVNNVTLMLLPKAWWKPGFFEAHYSEPTVLDALVCGSHIWSVTWFIQMNIFSWSTGVKWTKERCLLSPTGECLGSYPYLTWCHYIGTAIPKKNHAIYHAIPYLADLIFCFCTSTGCNQWAQRQLPNLSAILGNLDPKFPRGFCATKRQIYEKPLKNCREHKSNIGQHR